MTLCLSIWDALYPKVSCKAQYIKLLLVILTNVCIVLFVLVAGRQKPNRGARRPWSNAEASAVMKHFKLHIAKGHLASLRECELCKKCEPVLQNRTLQNIRDFVRNRGLTLKRKMTATFN